MQELNSLSLQGALAHRFYSEMNSNAGAAPPRVAGAKRQLSGVRPTAGGLAREAAAQ